MNRSFDPAKKLPWRCRSFGHKAVRQANILAVCGQGSSGWIFDRKVCVRCNKDMGAWDSRSPLK